MMEQEFIGKAYKTEDQKLEILQSYDEYQMQKLRFLNECYNSEATKMSYWTLYNTNLHYSEVNKGKDLMKFDASELKSLISTSIGMNTTKAAIGSFLSKYYQWACNRRFILFNPYSTIKTSTINSNSKRFLASKLYGLDLFYEICRDMEENTRIPNIIPFVLARYGIAGEKLYYMRHLKWEDIDAENLVVNIKDSDGYILSTLPIDKKFLTWIDKAKNYTQTTESELNQDGEDISKRRVIQYIDYGYVLKKALEKKANNNVEDQINKYHTIYNRGNVACTSIGIKRIAFKDLVRTRQLELLLQIRKKRRLQFSDFEDIVKKFSLEKNPVLDNRAFTLKKRYEELTHDTVIIWGKEALNDIPEDSEAVAQALIDELKLGI